ncbi:MAG: ADP-ribosylglycohydrolase family protein [Chloroflexota bacterium]|nr:ADP-ribosylglycohydrolase family protein [Chloroflexota bacterium]
MSSARDLENRFLGSLLGLAIGDALGMPVAELSVEEAREQFGVIRDYKVRDEGEETQVPAGEITDETETVLCIVESMTTNNGHIDAENVNARLLYLAEGPSRHWMPESMQRGIREAAEREGLLPESHEPGGSLAVAVRGVPVGLMHSVGGYSAEALVEDARTVSRLTHGGVPQQQLVVDVAVAVVDLVRTETIERVELPGDLSSVSESRETITAIWNRVREGNSFEEIVFDAVNRYRPADSAGAIAGALAGAALGASAIPQRLIDGLEARVYLSLAAPWFYRTATRRAGTVIDLRQV